MITIQMTGDWGVGSGTGSPGAVDRALVRDPLGLPFIPAKTLTGVLRRAAEEAAAALDNPGPDQQPDGGSGTTWAAWVEWLFGTQAQGPRRAGPDRPWQAAISIRPARIPEALARALVAEDLVAATTAVRPSTAIDQDTGTTRPRSLRLLETARRDLPLEARITASVDGVPTEIGQLPEEARILLRLACRLAAGVGGKRRRGLGNCAIDIKGLGDDAVILESLRRLDAPGSPPAQPVPAPTAVGGYGAGTGAPLRLAGTIDLELLTPVTVASQVRSNTILSARNVPGTMLIPLALRGLPDGADALLRVGRIVVTDATPLAGENRSVAAPACLRREKRGDDTVLWNELRPTGEVRRLVSTRVMLDPGADPAAPIPAGDVSIVEHGHAVIDDAKQRPTEHVGGLFIQQAIAAGTRLRAQVWAPDDVVFAPEQLPARYTVGTAKKDDYGLVAVGGEVPDAAPEPGVEGRSIGEVLTVWFQSDALLRDPSGAWTTEPTAVAAAVAEALGLPAALVDDDLPSHILGTRPINSWAQRWGKPRPTLIAVAAGSVIRIRPGDGVDRSKLLEAIARVEADGLGDRRGEGFGRVAVDHPLLLVDRVELQPPHAGTAPGGPGEADGGQAGEQQLAAEHDAVLRTLRRDAWRARAMDAAEQVALTTAMLRGLPRGELGALRSVALGLDGAGGAAAAQAWLATAGSKLEKLRDLISDPTTIFAIIGAEPPGSEDEREAIAADVRRHFLYCAVKARETQERSGAVAGGTGRV